jgi:hypothetical protein
MSNHAFTSEFPSVLGFTLFALTATFPLPPGPRGYPLVGNLFDMPSLHSQSWLTFAKWGEEYGIVYTVSMLLEIK